MIELVKVSNFSIGKYTVTNSQYLEFCKQTGGNWPEWLEIGSAYNLGTSDYYLRFNGPDQPVVGINMENMEAFCDWLSQKTGDTYRLPTEEEWEEAAGGGFEYSGSDDVDEVAWYYDNSERKTQPVGLKKPNKLGIYDMSGNVRECCKEGLFCGGSWNDCHEFVGCFDRSGDDPSSKNICFGFRVARDN